jgi:hypothetical protein
MIEVQQAAEPLAAAHSAVPDMGHAHITSTYWYLTAIHELMAVTARRFENYARTGGAR